MASRRSGPNPFFIPLALFVLLVAAVVFVAMKNKQAAQEAPASAPEVVQSPFDDLPEEQPRERSQKSSPAGSTRDYQIVGKMPDLSGNPLAADEAWVTAAAAGAQADVLFDEALAAREESDYSGFQESGRQARDLYEQTLEATAEYATQVAEEHGDADPNVRAIVRARTFWEERRSTLRKLVR